MAVAVAAAAAALAAAFAALLLFFAGLLSTSFFLCEESCVFDGLHTLPVDAVLAAGSVGGGSGDGGSGDGSNFNPSMCGGGLAAMRGVHTLPASAVHGFLPVQSVQVFLPLA